MSKAIHASQKTPLLTPSEKSQLDKFLDKLDQFCEHAPQVPDQLAVRVQQRLQMKPGRAYDDGKVRPTPVLEVLNELGEKDWYKYADRVAAKINKEEFAEVSNADKKDYEERFRAILFAYKCVPLMTSTRGTKTNNKTSFHINQLAGIKGDHKVQAHFPLHKTPQTLRNHLREWQRIHQYLRTTDHTRIW